MPALRPLPSAARRLPVPPGRPTALAPCAVALAALAAALAALAGLVLFAEGAAATHNPLFQDDFSAAPSQWTTHAQSDPCAPAGATAGTWDGANGWMRLTDGHLCVGALMVANALLPTDCWTAEYRYRLGTGVAGTNDRADGIVFLFYKDFSYAPAFAMGGGLGQSPAAGGTAAGYAVEVDTWMNGWDGGGNHVALMQGDYQTHLVATGTGAAEDGVWHRMVVNYETGTLNATVDGTLHFNVTFTASTAHRAFGFSATSGSAGQNQQWLDDVEILPCAPVAEFGGNAVACVGQAFTFFDMSQAKSGGTITTQHWDFGDGTTLGPGNHPTASHAYAAPGTYIVTLTVTDSWGHTTTVQHTVTVVLCDPRHTWAGGDLFDGELWVTGNDPGCNTGMPAGPAAPAQVDSFTLTGFTPRPWLLGPRFLHGGATLTDPAELLVVVGGTDSCTPFAPLGTSEFITSPTGAWQAGPALTPRIAPAVATDGSTVWVAGGDGTGGDPHALASLHRPTPRLESATHAQVVGGVPFTGLPDLPAGVVGAAGLWDPVEGRFVVAGGYSHPQVQNRLIQTYDPANGTWLGRHLPQARTGHAAVSCDGDAWVVGGFAGAAQPMHAYVGPVAPTTKWDGTAWVPAAPPPAPLAYAAVAGLDNRYVLASGGAAGLFAPQIRVLDCAAGTWSTGFGIPWAHGRAEAGSAVGRLLLEPTLAPNVPDAGFEQGWYIVGGTSLSGAGPSGFTEGGCPTDIVTRTTFTSLPPGPVTSATAPLAPLPVATAAMGTAALPDGRIVVVGGRVSGTDAAGAASCRIPTAATYVYDPLLNAWYQGPSLPKGVIAPAVSVDDWRVTVHGGDDQGDFPVPATVWDTMPRRPSSDVHSLNFLLVLPPIGTPLGPLALQFQWTTEESLPMGVVAAQAVTAQRTPFLSAPGDSPTADVLVLRDALFVVGGSHHPHASVRLVQERVPSAALLAVDGTDLLGASVAWDARPLPVAMAHHGLEICPDGRTWIAFVGTRTGPVFWESPPSDLSDDTWLLPPGATDWQPFDPQPLPRAFPVAHSHPAPFYATGTVPGQQRTDDAHPLLCVPPDPTTVPPLVPCPWPSSGWVPNCTLPPTPQPPVLCPLNGTACPPPPCQGPNAPSWCLPCPTTPPVWWPSLLPWPITSWPDDCNECNLRNTMGCCGEAHECPPPPCPNAWGMVTGDCPVPCPPPFVGTTPNCVLDPCLIPGNCPTPCPPPTTGTLPTCVFDPCTLLPPDVNCTFSAPSAEAEDAQEANPVPSWTWAPAPPPTAGPLAPPPGLG